MLPLFNYYQIKLQVLLCRIMNKTLYPAPFGSTTLHDVNNYEQISVPIRFIGGSGMTMLLSNMFPFL